MDEATKKHWKEITTRLIVHIGDQIGMEMNDQILMMMVLNTPEKVKKFSDWARAHEENDAVTVSPARVLSAATRIGRGMEPLPDEAYEETNRTE